MCNETSNFTHFSEINDTTVGCTLILSEELAQLWNIYFAICYASGIYLCILSILTAFANGILLFVLYKDPLKHKSRHPLTVFIIGIASADFFTGLAVEPLFAYFYFKASQDKISDSDYNILLKAGTVLSGMSMNVSFLVVLFLSWAQLIAILYPHKQKQIVTPGRAAVCVVGAWIYACAFSFLNMMGVPVKIFHKIDVYLHLTAVQIVIIISYIALCIAYKRHLHKLTPFLDIAKVPSATRALEQHKRTQRQLVAVNLMLTTCLIVFVLPVTVVWYINLYWQPSSHTDYVKSIIGSVAIDTTLYMKFLIDPFIYGWRLPKFRQAVVAMFQGRRTSNLVSLAMFSKTISPQN